ncbi:MAG: hypothetical protein KatS3mg057_1311 [Herpetosiphonaceae bacterium]|nr:MAG: hypothetical protein KatS3mg057_1311 [Herpetosiphonaceae bacterium]
MEELIRETRSIWDQNAPFWDSVLGDEGNRFHRTIVQPAVLNLLSPQPKERILEIACGNGAFARTMAQLGSNVVASDFSAALLERARERTRHKEYADRIEYLLLDATNEEELLSLGEGQFDAAVCTMGLMDMPVIDPLLRALSRLLRRAGRFVFSIQHPCFNSNGAVKTVKLEDRNGTLTRSYSISVSRYKTPWAERGTGIVGQPTPHYYFHRPLYVLLNSCFEAGFVMDGIEEPIDPAEPNDEKWPAWSNYKELPPVLVVRVRLR